MSRLHQTGKDCIEFTVTARDKAVEAYQEIMTDAILKDLKLGRVSNETIMDRSTQKNRRALQQFWIATQLESKKVHHWNIFILFVALSVLYFLRLDLSMYLCIRAIDSREVGDIKAELDNRGIRIQAIGTGTMLKFPKRMQRI